MLTTKVTCLTPESLRAHTDFRSLCGFKASLLRLLCSLPGAALTSSLLCKPALLCHQDYRLCCSRLMTDTSTLLSALRGTHRVTRTDCVIGCDRERNNCGGDNASCWSGNNTLAAVWTCSKALSARCKGFTTSPPQCSTAGWNELIIRSASVAARDKVCVFSRAAVHQRLVSSGKWESDDVTCPGDLSPLLEMDAWNHLITRPQQKLFLFLSVLFEAKMKLAVALQAGKRTEGEHFATLEWN